MKTSIVLIAAIIASGTLAQENIDCIGCDNTGNLPLQKCSDAWTLRVTQCIAAPCFQKYSTDPWVQYCGKSPSSSLVNSPTVIGDQSATPSLTTTTTTSSTTSTTTSTLTTISSTTTTAVSSGSTTSATRTATGVTRATTTQTVTSTTTAGNSAPSNGAPAFALVGILAIGALCLA